MPVPQPPSSVDAIREWLILFAAFASATFAGLIWWLARKRLTTQYVLTLDRVGSDAATVRGTIAINNRSEDRICVERISVDPPLGLLVDDRGSVYGRSSEPLKVAREGSYEFTVEPDSASSHDIVLARDGGFAGCNRASIRLHILSSFPTIRHKKKTLTAILPASIRSTQA